MSPVTTIFEPKPSRVRNIFICSGLVFCASSRITNESLSVRPRMKASGATSITPRSRCGATFSGSIMSCSASNSGRRYGIDLGHQVAGQEAEPLAGLDRGAGEDDPVDLAPGQRRGGHRDGQERLAGARRADAERDRVAADRVDVALLVDRLGGDPRRAVAPDDVLEDLGRRLVLVERAGHRIDRSRADLVALLDEVATARARRSRRLRTASASPSRVMTLPRRNSSQSRWPSSARRTASWEPLSAAATSLESSSWRRT